MVGHERAGAATVYMWADATHTVDDCERRFGDILEARRYAMGRASRGAILPCVVTIQYEPCSPPLEWVSGQAERVSVAVEPWESR